MTDDMKIVEGVLSLEMMIIRDKEGVMIMAVVAPIVVALTIASGAAAAAAGIIEDTRIVEGAEVALIAVDGTTGEETSRKVEGGSAVAAMPFQSEAFVPAVIVADPVAASPGPTPSASPSGPEPVGRMEIVLKGGDRVIVGADFDAAA